MVPSFTSVAVNNSRLLAQDVAEKQSVKQEILLFGYECVGCHAINLFTISTSDICLFSYEDYTCLGEC